MAAATPAGPAPATKTSKAVAAESECSWVIDKVLLVTGREVDQIMEQMATNRPQTHCATQIPRAGFFVGRDRARPGGDWLRSMKGRGSFFARSVLLSVALLAAGRQANPRRIVREHCAAFLRQMDAIGQLHVDFEGFEDAAKWRGSVVCPNHPSLLDALFLFSKIPDVDCVIGQNPWRDPLLAVPARRAAYVPSEPAGAMLRECRRRLAGGANIIIFPEGTRTAGGVVNPFQCGFALPAIKSDTCIRTVFIECDSMALGKGFSFFSSALPPIRFRISAGEVFESSGIRRARELSDEIERYFRANLRRKGDHILRTVTP